MILRSAVVFLRAAALLLFMPYTPTFTYQGGANPTIDYIRLLVSDTQQFAPDGTTPIFVFGDSEIQAAYVIEQNVWMSPQFFSGVMGQTTEQNPPVSYRRVAATLLDALAANKSRLASIKQMLDVKLDSSDAAIQLRETAQALRDTEDNSGAFVIIEQVNDEWSFRDRFWKTIQRENAA